MVAGLPHAAVIHTKPFSDWNGDDAGATDDDGAADDVVDVDDTDVDEAEVDAAGTAFPPVCPQPARHVVTAKPSTASDNLTAERGTRLSFTTTILIGADLGKSPQFLHNRCRKAPQTALTVGKREANPGGRRRADHPVLGRDPAAG
ncbi:hypothetical protein [Mycobacterium sp. SMC-13]